MTLLKNNIENKIFTFRNVLILAVLVSLGVSASEFFRGEHANFMIFRNAALDFWNGVSPYGEQWWRHGLDYYLYAPPFSVLFTPFALLPEFIGVFVWNLFNALMLALSIYTLPRISNKTKAYMLLYLLPILGAGQLDFQYNIAIAYMFLFAYTLFETDKGKWAMLIIMVSAVTKIYGGFELLLLLVYPKFWKNVAWGVLWAVLLLALPIVKVDMLALPQYYQEWIARLSQHSHSRYFETFFDIKLIWGSDGNRAIVSPYQAHIQVGVWAGIVALTVWRRSWREWFNYRAGLLAVITGYIILFSGSSEKHTYIIALVGMLVWWWNKPMKNVIDKILFWMVLFVIVLVPVDVIVPWDVMMFLCYTIDINKWIFLCAWLYICYDTFLISGKYKKIE